MHKLKEVQEMLSNSMEVLSLKDIGCFEDIEETEITLEGNAKLKADYITKKYGFDCFADDTGLEVEALDGKPGGLFCEICWRTWKCREKYGKASF